MDKASHPGVTEGLLHQKAKGKVGTARDISGEKVEQGAHQAGGEISKHRVLNQLEEVAGETVRRRKEPAVGKKWDGGMRAIGERKGAATGERVIPNHAVGVGGMGKVVEVLVGTQKWVHGVIGMREILEGHGELEVQEQVEIWVANLTKAGVGRCTSHRCQTANRPHRKARHNSSNNNHSLSSVSRWTQGPCKGVGENQQVLQPRAKVQGGLQGPYPNFPVALETLQSPVVGRSLLHSPSAGKWRLMMEHLLGVTPSTTTAKVSTCGIKTTPHLARHNQCPLSKDPQPYSSSHQEKCQRALGIGTRTLHIQQTRDQE